jgi:hypothetical protein
MEKKNNHEESPHEDIYEDVDERDDRKTEKEQPVDSSRVEEEEGEEEEGETKKTLDPPNNGEYFQNVDRLLLRKDSIDDSVGEYCISVNNIDTKFKYEKFSISITKKYKNSEGNICEAVLATLEGEESTLCTLFSNGIYGIKNTKPKEQMRFVFENHKLGAASLVKEEFDDISEKGINSVFHAVTKEQEPQSRDFRDLVRLQKRVIRDQREKERREREREEKEREEREREKEKEKREKVFSKKKIITKGKTR